MLYAFQFLATLSTCLFSGAAIYINLVEHPARMGATLKRRLRSGQRAINGQQ